MSVTVLKPGLQTTIQSRPRHGLRHLGIATSGAGDPMSLALANKLVGNDWHTPALEATLLGPTLRFDARCTFAITGAIVQATLNGQPIALHATTVADAGAELITGAAESGARFYIAVAGGFCVEAILGSPSTDLLAAFGGHSGRVLQTGDELQIAARSVALSQTPEAFRFPMSSSWALRATASVETALLDERGKQQLFNTNWAVGQRMDRMGINLVGPALNVASDGRLPSAAVFPGTVQCPEDGSPYILSVDAGTVGGYPRVAQVARVDRHLLGQLRPGNHVRLLNRDPDDAVEALEAKIDYWRAWLPDIAEILT